MRIPLLYRGEYSQGRKRFMNYLEEQMDGEAMINSIQNEKKTRKIDRLARSLLIQRISNDIYSLIDSNDTAKNLWDALERQMRGSEYGEQDRKAVILYEYETFQATEGEQLLDTYLHYLQVINDLKKCGYKKDNCDVNDAFGYKKKTVVVTSDPLALVAEKTKVLSDSEESSSSSEETITETIHMIMPSKDTVYHGRKGLGFENPSYFCKAKELRPSLYDESVIGLGYTLMFLTHSNEALETKKFKRARENKIEFVYNYGNLNILWIFVQDNMSRDVLIVGSTMRISLLYRGEYSQWVERFMNYLEEQTDGEAMINSIKNVEKKDDEKKRDMSRVKCYNYKKERHFAKDCKKVKVKDYEYYKTKMLLAKKDKDEQVLLAEDQVIGLGYTSTFLTHSDEALEIEKFKRSRENKIEFAYDFGNLNASYVNEKINFEDDYFQEIINPDFEKIDSPFQQTSSLKSYVPNVILEEIIINLEDEVVNLLEKEKVNLETIESLKSKSLESSETAIFESENQSENDCLVVENEGDKEENSK
nr:hypothetical protein [Tanacetum cinerariifolium]